MSDQMLADVIKERDELKAQVERLRELLAAYHKMIPTNEARELLAETKEAR